MVTVAALPVPQAAAQVMEQLALPKEGRSMRATSAARLKGSHEIDPDSNADRLAFLPAGETHVLMDEKGPGAITHIWMTFLGPDPHPWAPEGSANHQEMLLRIFYDGDERPGVEAPVGDFFANCFGKRSEVISLPVVVEDADSYNCFWRMPFRKSVRVEVVNQSAKAVGRLYYNIDWIKLDALPADTPYFYAQYRQEYPVEKGKDYLLLETRGKGHYVGTVLAVRMRSPAWFGEGDEKIYIDGEEKPSIWGTGTEDYFLSAWGLKTVVTPCFGTPFFDQRGVGGHTSAYRWHVADPIVFQKSIKVTIEHYGWMSPDENPRYESTSWNEREDDYASVAFWYQTGRPTFTARAPHARERALPSLDRAVFYAADADDAKRRGPGQARVQSRPGYPKGHLLYQPTDPREAWLEIPFRVEEKAPLRLMLCATRSYDFGRYQASLNGVKLGRPLDFYRPETDAWEYPLLDFWPEPGEYVLRLDGTGKDPASSGHGAGIESVRLRERRPRVKEWAHDKDKDWRRNPTLYR
ncbi:MAG: DUF2961 domain-containing protein [Phycisphaerae bacterium]|jgi:hypothetical protein